VKTSKVEVGLMLSSYIRRKEKKCRLAVGKILVAERFKF
jgi:hypothetical protein